jgi:hypothetical protein
MTFSEMSYPALTVFLDHTESTGSHTIVSNVHVASARQSAAAAMSVAITKGDVEGVLAALRQLGEPSTSVSLLRK